MFVRLVVILMTLSLSGLSQERYLTQLFDSVSVETYTYATKDGQNLALDLYTPFADTATNRPLLLYVHGGGFSSGNRNAPHIISFCQYFASFGYSCASISYRLTRKDHSTEFGCDCPAVEKLNTFKAAVEDLQDATFFLITNRESLGIDPQKIILAGSSAGAEAILNAGYQPPMCYGLESGPVSYAGLISMAGAIPDTTVIYEESAIPSLLFHGTCDDVVPYVTAPHRYCKPGQPGYLMMNGSQDIARKLARLGVPYWLHSTCGAGHSVAKSPMTDYPDVMLEFCYHFILHPGGESKHTIIPGQPTNCTLEPLNFCHQ